NNEENLLTDGTDSKKVEEKPKKKKRFFIWVLRIFLGSIFVIGSFLMMTLYQTNTRQFILNKIINYVNEELNGKLKIEDINFFNPLGIELKNVTLTVANDTILSTKSILVDLEFKKLLNNKISIHKLEILNPKIKLIAINDSTWNFDKIAKPSKDSSKSPPNLIIDLQSLKMINASIL